MFGRGIMNITIEIKSQDKIDIEEHTTGGARPSFISFWISVTPLFNFYLDTLLLLFARFDNFL